MYVCMYSFKWRCAKASFICLMFSVFLVADIMKVIVTALLHSSAIRWRSRCFITQQASATCVYYIHVQCSCRHCYRLMAVFLAGSSQQVLRDDYPPNSKLIFFGVSQTSVSGPTLFMLDMVRRVRRHCLVLLWWLFVMQMIHVSVHATVAQVESFRLTECISILPPSDDNEQN